MTSPIHPELYQPVSQWPRGNAGFYARFRRWLKEGGYGESALSLYSIAARLALSVWNKPYWMVDVEPDLEQVRQVIRDNYASESTRSGYFKGLLKLEEYLRRINRQPAPPKLVNWDHFLTDLPDWLATAVRDYITHCRRNWRPEEWHLCSAGALGRLTPCLRWVAARYPLDSLADLTPPLWYAYLDERLAAGVTTKTTNGELSTLQSFLRFRDQAGQPVCDRFLLVERLKQGPHLPRDLPVEQLHRLLTEIEAEAASDQPGKRRAGIMDRAWFLLMLHSGLRMGEVRRLGQADLDLAGQRVRIEQSKGLKDRIVYLSPATVAAIEAYLPLRGPLLTDELFVSWHRPLSLAYCTQRLRTYGRRCGVKVTSHQLRHSCATLLLNAGAPILTVQALLGHRQIDTTLAYARLYDGTVAADYYRAMATVEQRLTLCPATASPLPATGQLVALVDALSNGTLNDNQRELVHALRVGLLALAEKGMEAENGLSSRQARCKL